MAMQIRSLKVHLYSARNLAIDNSEGFYDPYCSLTVNSTTSTVSSPKSSYPKRKAANPVWNQSLVFPISYTENNFLHVKFFDKDDQENVKDIGNVWVALTNVSSQEAISIYKINDARSGEVEIGIVLRDDSSAVNAPVGTGSSPQTTPAANRVYHSLSDPNSGSTPPVDQLYPLRAQAQQARNISPSTQSPNIVQNANSGVSPTPGILPAQTPNQVIGNFGQPPQSDSPSSFDPKGAIRRSETYGGIKHRQVVRQHGILTAFAPHEVVRDYPYLARGSYGIVFKGTAKGIPKKVVIKDMDIRDNRSVEEWQKELRVMSENRCPYICEIYGYSSAENVLTIVMEYMPLGDLFGILYKKSEAHPLSMLQRVRMARHCALGIAFLHQNHVMHRDVKSMNVLVSEDYSCKLTDFGCAKLISDRQIYNTMNSGTPLWMAPEVKLGQYHYSADVYSLGLVLYELFEKKLPNFDQARQAVFLPHSFQSASVVVPCLNVVPDRRPSAQQVVNVLEKMISNIVKEVRKLLPQVEQDKIQAETFQINQELMDDKDALENELLVLYRHLLSKDPRVVDQLIDAAFQSNNTPQNPPQVMQQQPQPPAQIPYGTPHPVAYSMPHSVPISPLPPMGSMPMHMPGQVLSLPMNSAPMSVPPSMPPGLQYTAPLPYSHQQYMPPVNMPPMGYQYQMNNPSYSLGYPPPFQ